MTPSDDLSHVARTPLGRHLLALLGINLDHLEALSADASAAALASIALASSTLSVDLVPRVTVTRRTIGAHDAHRKG